jgi:ketosteroid isomerase-like protein
VARSTEQVLQDHITTLLNGDFPAMMADYADDAVLMTLDGAIVGKAAIQGYFLNALSALPNAKLSFAGHSVHGDFVLLTWTAVSDVETIPYGVDTFVIRDDRIELQTVWLTMILKSVQ